MKRERALAELPTAYAVALRMHTDGASPESIAQALGVPVESMSGLIGIAEAKLKSIVEAAATHQEP